MYPRLSIHIVAWNSMRFIPDLLKSIAQQTYKDFAVLLIDNGSTDGVVEFVRQQYPQVTILRNARNLGFTGAHNQGIRYALEYWTADQFSDRFILVTNPDLLFEPDCLEKLMSCVLAYPNVGAFGPKLHRAFGENQHDEVLQETVKSDLIDSTGLRAKKSRTFADRGAGEMDTGQYDAFCEVFGISGALALYRASALDDVRYKDEFFDQDFFAYKEDVDLAWRLQSAGWDARYVPEALAFHYRGMYGKEKMGWFEKLKNRRIKSPFRSYYSSRNHWLLLLKNERIVNGMLASWRIVPCEIARFVFMFIFEPAHLRALVDVFRFFPRMMKKRWDSLSRRKRTSRELRKWFVSL